MLSADVGNGRIWPVWLLTMLPYRSQFLSNYNSSALLSDIILALFSSSSGIPGAYPRVPDPFCILAKAWRAQCVYHTGYRYSMSNLGRREVREQKKKASPNPSALHLDTVNEIFKYVAVETIKEGGLCVCVCVF